MCVRWGSVCSDFFLVNNGVINVLSESLSKLPVACCCGNAVGNHLLYVGDIDLFASTAKGLQKTINVCCENDIILNSS